MGLESNEKNLIEYKIAFLWCNFSKVFLELLHIAEIAFLKISFTNKTNIFIQFI